MSGATCWDDPERCMGCNFCSGARYTDYPVWPLSPLEAHDRDTLDYFAARGGVLVNGVVESVHALGKYIPKKEMNHE